MRSFIVVSLITLIAFVCLVEIQAPNSVMAKLEAPVLPVPSNKPNFDQAASHTALVQSVGRETEEQMERNETLIFNIGEPMNPDDPNWRNDNNAEIFNIGEPMNPDDANWRNDNNAEIFNIGEPMNPDDTYSLPQTNSDEVFIIGESMDPGEPHSG